MTTKPAPQTKQTRKGTKRQKPEFSPFEIEQHAQANRAMSTIFAPC